jgi:hypothetical protein
MLDLSHSIFFQEPPDLLKLQTQEWLPVLDWFCKTMINSEIQPTSTISPPVITSDNREALMRYLLSFNFIALHGKIY